MTNNNWLETKLGNWGGFVARRRRTVLLAAGLITLASLPFVHRAVTHLDVNLFNQASNSLVRFKLVQQLAQDFGGDILAAVVSIPDQHTPEQVQELKAFGLLLRDELTKAGLAPEDREKLPESYQRELPADQPWLRQVEVRTGQGIEQALRKMVKDRPYVVLTPADVAELKNLFEPGALAAAMERVATALPDLPPNSAERIKLQEDPLGVSELASKALQSRLGKRKQALAGSDPEGFFVSSDGTTLVVLARAVLPATRLDFNRALMASAQRAENRAIESFRKTKPSLTSALKGKTYSEFAEGEKPGTLEVGFTGQPPVFVENEMSLKFDVALNTATSLLGVLILFAVAFRSLMLTWDVTWATILIIVWTVAFSGITKGGMSLLGGAFTAVPVGLGTDYMIFLYNTFHRLRRDESLSDEECLRQTLMRCGPSIITAALITSIAFYGIGFTHLTGLAEFGILGGTSALLGCVMMLLVYPAALCRSPRGVQLKMNEALPLFIPAWGRLLEKPAVRTASLALSVAMLAGVFLLMRFGPDPGAETVAGVRFDPELGNLRSLRIKAIPLRNRLFERFKMGFADLRVLVEAPDEDAAYAASDEVARRLQPFIDKGEISANGSVLDFVPSGKQQQASMAALKSFDFEAAGVAFRKAATERFGDKGIVFFKPFLKRVNEFGLLTREPSTLTLADVMKTPVGNLLAPFVKIDDTPGATSRVRLSSSWFPKSTAMPSEWYNSVAAALESNPTPGVGIHVTAARMVGFELKESTLSDCTWITIAVGFCVALSLGIAFRSLKASLLATIPLIFSLAVMLAGVPFSQWMGWDFSLNFVNLIMFPLLLGSAIDYGVYLVFEANSARRPNTAELLTHTGRSVFYCMGTTLIGFGSFVTSSYTGLISMGVASLWGYSGALFGALVTLPALLGMLREWELARETKRVDAAPISGVLTQEQAK